MHIQDGSAIDHQLSPCSFISYDPDDALAWLQDIGATPIATQGPSEAGRVRTEFGGEVVVFASGLIVALAPVLEVA